MSQMEDESDEELFFGKLSLKEFKKHIQWNGHTTRECKIGHKVKTDPDASISIIETHSEPNLRSIKEEKAKYLSSPSSPLVDVKSPTDDSFLQIENMVTELCVSPRTSDNIELNNTLEVIEYILKNAPKHDNHKTDNQKVNEEDDTKSKIQIDDIPKLLHVDISPIKTQLVDSPIKSELDKSPNTTVFVESPTKNNSEKSPSKKELVEYSYKLLCHQTPMTQFTESFKNLGFDKSPNQINFDERPKQLQCEKSPDQVKFHLEFVESPKKLEFVEIHKKVEFVESPKKLEYVESPIKLESVESPKQLQCDKSPIQVKSPEYSKKLEFVETPKQLQCDKSLNKIMFDKATNKFKFIKSPHTKLLVETHTNLHFDKSPSKKEFVESPDKLHSNKSPNTTQFTDSLEKLDFEKLPNQVNIAESTNKFLFIQSPNQLQFDESSVNEKPIMKLNATPKKEIIKPTICIENADNTETMNYFTPLKLMQNPEVFVTPSSNVKAKAQLFKTPAPLSNKKPILSAKKTPTRFNAYQHIASPVASYIKNCPQVPLVKEVHPKKPLPGPSSIPKLKTHPCKSHNKENINLPQVAYKSAKKTKVINIDREKLPQSQWVKKITSTLPRPTVMKHENRQMNPLKKQFVSNHEDSFANLSCLQAEVSVCTQKTAFKS